MFLPCKLIYYPWVIYFSTKISKNEDVEKGDKNKDKEYQTTKI